MPDQAPDGATPDVAPEAERRAAPEPSRALAVIDDGPGLGIIRAASPTEILEKASVIADALKGLIDRQGLSASMGGGRKHVEVGAWQACGTMLGALGGQALHAETVWTRPVLGDDGVTPRRTSYTAEVKHYKKIDGKREHVSTTTYDVDGLDWEAFVEIKTATGDVVGSAQAMVSRGEETWSRREDYALRSMAETRAESRAYRRAIGWIVNLAGFSATPQEEMPPKQGREFGPAASEAKTERMVAALAYLFDTGEGPRDDLAARAYNAIGTRLNYIPEAVADALRIAAATLKEAIDAAAGAATQAQDPPPEAVAEVVSGEVLDATMTADDEAEAALQARLANEF